MCQGRTRLQVHHSHTKRMCFQCCPECLPSWHGWRVWPTHVLLAIEVHPCEDWNMHVIFAWAGLCNTLLHHYAVNPPCIFYCDLATSKTWDAINRVRRLCFRCLRESFWLKWTDLYILYIYVVWALTHFGGVNCMALNQYRQGIVLKCPHTASCLTCRIPPVPIAVCLLTRSEQSVSLDPDGDLSSLWCQDTTPH